MSKLFPFFDKMSHKMAKAWAISAWQISTPTRFKGIASRRIENTR